MSAYAKSSSGSADHVPKNYVRQTLVFPASTIGQFGSNQFSIWIRNSGNFRIHEIILQFQCSALSITGTDPSGNYPNMSPCPFWVQKYDIRVGGVSIEGQRLDFDQFVLNQILNTDEERLAVNYAMGDYLSDASRLTQSSSQSDYYLPLKCFVSECNYPLINQNLELEIQLTLAQLANVANLASSGQSAPNITINAINALVHCTMLPTNIVNNMTTTLSSAKGGIHTFHRLVQQSYPFNSTGTAVIPMTLNGIVGPIEFLYFVVRPISSLTNEGAWTSALPISSFYINNSSGQNIVGGTPVYCRELQLVLGKHWSLSSFFTEHYSGANASNVYLYSWSTDPISAILKGNFLSGYTFTGNEQLNITMAANITSPVQVDVYCYKQSVMIQKINGVTVSDYVEKK